MNNLLKMGAPLQIFNNLEQRYYVTGIKEIGANSLTIHFPVYADQVLQMAPGSQWRACLIGMDALYYFNTRVMEVIHGPAPVYIISRPESVDRCQRRKLVRLSCCLNITYQIFHDPPGPETKEGNLPHPRGEADREYPAVIVDLSGGGLRMVTREEIPRQTPLLLNIPLAEKQGVHQVRGTVLRVTPINSGGWKRYQIGVVFSTTTGSQEKIIRYLFNLMRKRLKDCCP